jgi:hypothetical protein
MKLREDKEKSGKEANDQQFKKPDKLGGEVRIERSTPQNAQLQNVQVTEPPVLDILWVYRKGAHQ